MFMRSHYFFSVLLLAGTVSSVLAEVPSNQRGLSPQKQYSLGPDSQQHPGVPEGRLVSFVLPDSKTFPGFEHKWWLYIPTQYTDRKPVPLMVFLDGEAYMKRDGHWRAAVVLDNLLARKELPVMAAVFVDPGVSIGKWDNGEPFYSNRSVEYDTLSAAYATFILEEILPEARKHVHITDDPEGRGIAGCSSGGIGAFTAAWQRPDQFRKVISFSGSFVNIRGGHVYPDLVRREDRKPIRTFLQVGANDIVTTLGAALDTNKVMSAALDEKRYDHRFFLDQSTHCSVLAASSLPNAMRWTWRDYPR